MLPVTSIIGVPRIELGPHAPEACILPLYYTPKMEITRENVRPPSYYILLSFFRASFSGWTVQDSNLWPLPCEGNALTN